MTALLKAQWYLGREQARIDILLGRHPELEEEPEDMEQVLAVMRLP